MKYEDIVEKVREVYEYADAREIYEHIAIQVNVTGEGSGIFYIEVAQRMVCVEPYDYYDRDVLLVADSSTVIGIADGHIKYDEALADGRLELYGNADKFNQFATKIKVKRKKKTKNK